MNILRLLAALAVPMLLAVAPPAPPAAGGDPGVTQLIERSGAALHVDAMRGIQVLYFEGKATGAGLSGVVQNWIQIGGARSSETYSLPPISGGNGWDGSEAWNEDSSGQVWVDGSDAGRSQALTSAFLLNYDLWKPHFGGATVAYAGERNDQGRTYDVLAVSVPGSQIPADLWIDRATALPERIVEVVGPTTYTLALSDYRPVDGLMLPYAQTDTTSDGNSNALTVTQVAVNPADGQERLRKPAADVRDFSIAGGASQTVVPIELSENHVYLSVMLDGKGPYRFIFDTGGQNVVDPAVAKAIGAFGKGEAQGGGVGAATQSLSFAKVDTLQIGDATLKDQLFAVAPVRQGFGITAGQPVDGLIGFEVLSRFVTTFDYAGGRVVLQMPGTYQAPAHAGVIPIVLDGTQPQFGCAIDGVLTECTIDTGSRASLSLFTPFIKAHPQVVPTALTADGVNGFGFGGAELGKLARVRTLSFGTFTLPDLVGDYSTMSQGAFAAPFIGANVGGGVWKRFTMTLDYGKLTMTLTPNAGYELRDSYDRSGLFLIDKAGTVTIIDARPGTPAAAAGLAKGDAIVSLDGTPTASMSLQAIRERLSGTPGTVVHLMIEGKGGATRAVTLTLADYV
ncbi:MAG TPA: aspartyl protease family protein [Verrucomicrobiae bacterium]|nr:aspartyl protease family protein [Verrucomicrobiae bacterium]